jgi:hypothetical protein
MLMFRLAIKKIEGELTVGWLDLDGCAFQVGYFPIYNNDELTDAVKDCDVIVIVTHRTTLKIEEQIKKLSKNHYQFFEPYKKYPSIYKGSQETKEGATIERYEFGKENVVEFYIDKGEYILKNYLTHIIVETIEKRTGKKCLVVSISDSLAAHFKEDNVLKRCRTAYENLVNFEKSWFKDKTYLRGLTEQEFNELVDDKNSQYLDVSLILDAEFPNVAAFRIHNFDDAEDILHFIKSPTLIKHNKRVPYVRRCDLVGHELWPKHFHLHAYRVAQKTERVRIKEIFNIQAKEVKKIQADKKTEGDEVKATQEAKVIKSAPPSSTHLLQTLHLHAPKPVVVISKVHDREGQDDSMRLI